MYKFYPFSPHSGSVARELVHSYALGCLWVVTVCCHTVGRHGRVFCRPHAYTFNEQSKMATALTPQTDFTSEKVTWLMENPRQQSRPAYRKYNRLKTNINIFIFIFTFFYFIKYQTSDSFVNHFDGHFAYLKTLDFSFKKGNDVSCLLQQNKK